MVAVQTKKARNMRKDFQKYEQCISSTQSVPTLLPRFDLFLKFVTNHFLYSHDFGLLIFILFFNTSILFLLYQLSDHVSASFQIKPFCAAGYKSDGTLKQNQFSAGYRCIRRIRSPNSQLQSAKRQWPMSFS